MHPCERHRAVAAGILVKAGAIGAGRAGDPFRGALTSVHACRGVPRAVPIRGWRM